MGAGPFRGTSPFLRRITGLFETMGTHMSKMKTYFKKKKESEGRNPRPPDS